MGTYGGVRRCDDEGPPTLALAAADGLGEDRITAIFQDRHGSMWFGGHHGTLTRYDAGRFTVYDTTHGLPAHRTWSIAEDRGGHLQSVVRHLITSTSIGTHGW